MPIIVLTENLLYRSKRYLEFLQVVDCNLSSIGDFIFDCTAEHMRHQLDVLDNLSLRGLNAQAVSLIEFGSGLSKASQPLRRTRPHNTFDSLAEF